MRLVFARTVRGELIEIGDAIRSDSPQRAISFVLELEDKAYRIAQQPRLYRVRPDIGPDIRLATHGKYVILFRADDETVEILHIVHGARDLRHLFDM